MKADLRGHKPLHATVGLLLVAQSLLAQPPALQAAVPQLPLTPQRSETLANPGAPTALINSTSSVLPAESAFALTTVLEGDTSVLLHWAIAPGHYLYRDKLTVTAPDGQTLAVNLPPATALHDEYFGDTFVYFDSLQLRLPTQALTAGPGMLRLELGYQGCAKDRYCYPPLSRAVELTLPR